MRLEARIKMGYYPTPLSVVERIRSFFKFPEENVNPFDPCCGEGLALRGLKGEAKATTYGIDLDECGAEEAKRNVDHVIKGDYDEGNERKEKTFLKGYHKIPSTVRCTCIYNLPEEAEQMRARGKKPSVPKMDRRLPFLFSQEISLRQGL